MKLRIWPQLLPVVLITAAVVPMAWYGVSVTLRWFASDRVTAARDDVSMARRKFERLQKAAAAQAAVPMAEPAAGRWQLPDTPDVTGTMQILSALADEARVTLQGLRVVPTPHGDRTVFHLEGAGQPTSLCSYLAGIEIQPHLLVIDHGVVAASDGGGISFQFTVTAWHGGGAR